MHNTLMLDRRPQCEPSGPFQWQSQASARARGWWSGRGCDYVVADHAAYRPHRHTRAVLAVHGVGWWILDRVTGEGSMTSCSTGICTRHGSHECETDRWTCDMTVERCCRSPAPRTFERLLRVRTSWRCGRQHTVASSRRHFSLLDAAVFCLDDMRRSSRQSRRRASSCRRRHDARSGRPGGLWLAGALGRRLHDRPSALDTHEIADLSRRWGTDISRPTRRWPRGSKGMDRRRRSSSTAPASGRTERND